MPAFHFLTTRGWQQSATHSIDVNGISLSAEQHIEHALKQVPESLEAPVAVSPFSRREGFVFLSGGHAISLPFDAVKTPFGTIRTK